MKKMCDYCGRGLPLKRKRFCCNKHKDKWHNLHNPRGIFAYLNSVQGKIDVSDVEREFHPHDPYALGQWDD